MKNIGPTLKALRKLRGLTQDQLSDKSGVPKTVISYLETGRRVPTANVLTAIADALGYEVQIKFVLKSI